VISSHSPFYLGVESNNIYLMRKQGKFLLFDSAAAFASWLDGVTVSRRIMLVQNHHTFVPNYATFTGNNHFALMQAMENAHIERGFAEIAQNLSTFPDGTVAVGRGLDKIPAGIKGANTGGICIEHVGNFDVGGDAMSAEQRDAIIQVNAILCRKFGLSPNTNTIVYHHWYDLNTGERTNGTGTTKTCPGTNFFGGNTVADATARFVPLIAAALGAAPPLAGRTLVVAHATFIVNASNLNVREAPDGTARVASNWPGASTWKPLKPGRTGNESTRPSSFGRAPAFWPRSSSACIRTFRASLICINTVQCGLNCRS
jgi:hypothetical protein